MNFDGMFEGLDKLIAVTIVLASVGVIAIILGIVWLFTHVTIGVQP